MSSFVGLPVISSHPKGDIRHAGSIDKTSDSASVIGKPNCLYSSSELTDIQEEIFLNVLDRLKDEELEEFLSKALEINKRHLKANKGEETDSDVRDGIIS